MPIVSSKYMKSGQCGNRVIWTTNVLCLDVIFIRLKIEIAFAIPT